MFGRGIVKKSAADVIFWLNSKGSLLWRKNLRKLCKYQFHLLNFYSKPKVTLVVLFLWSFTLYDDFRGIDLSKTFPLIFNWFIRNSNMFLQICFHECISNLLLVPRFIGLRKMWVTDLYNDFEHGHPDGENSKH